MRRVSNAMLGQLVPNRVLKLAAREVRNSLSVLEQRDRRYRGYAEFRLL